MTDLGYGRITAINPMTVESGESAVGRNVFGALTGGLVGFGIANNTEANLDQKKLVSYQLHMTNGIEKTLQSNSLAALGDCVDVNAVGEDGIIVLERVSANAAREPAAKASRGRRFEPVAGAFSLS